MSIKDLVKTRMSKNVKFMGQNIEINKLSVSEVLSIQERASEVSKSSNELEGFEVLKEVIRYSVTDAKDLSDEDFNSFPMDELSNLSNEIMKFSGLGQQEGK